ncbi:hypothetical protein ACNQUF_12310, partial [Corynebacterium diphtheriae]
RPRPVRARPDASESLEQEIYDITTEGLPESQRDTYFQATAIVADPEANEDAVKQALADQGLLAQTLEEQLGVIRGIIDAVTWVLTGSRSSRCSPPASASSTPCSWRAGAHRRSASWRLWRPRPVRARPDASESLEQEIYDITTEGLPESQR